MEIPCNAESTTFSQVFRAMQAHAEKYTAGLLQSLDKDKDGTITYEEFKEKFGEGMLRLASTSARGAFSKGS